MPNVSDGRRKNGGQHNYDWSKVKDPSPFFLPGNKSRIPNLPNTGQNRALGPGIALCGAKKDDRVCYAGAMFNGRCKRHGGRKEDGTAPVGQANGFQSGPENNNWEGGRYSRYMPKRLLASYHRAASDPELLALRDDQAVLEARLGELLARAEQEAPDWAEARTTVRMLKGQMRDGDYEGANHSADLLTHLTEKGVQDDALWRQVERVVDRRRKVTETEQKRVLSSQMLVSKREVISVAVAMGNSVQTHVKDPKVINAIANDLQRIVGPQLRALLGAGTGNAFGDVPLEDDPGDDAGPGPAG